MNDVYDTGIEIHAKLNLTDLFRNYAELLNHEIQRSIRQGNSRIHSLRESRFRRIWSASRGLFDASCADAADDDLGSPRESPRIYKLFFLHKFEFECQFVMQRSEFQIRVARAKLNHRFVCV